MQVTYHVARGLATLLEECKSEYVPRDACTSSEWEKRRKKVRKRLSKLSTYLDEGASMVSERYTTGRRRKLSLADRSRLLLFAVMTGRSNRDMESLLELLSSLFRFKVSYKTIERLYSDVGVSATLHNAYVLMLRDEGTSGHFAGDGTGYSLKVRDHYSERPEKRNDAYRYSFALIDLKTGFYSGYGYSSRSEKEAYERAIAMTREMGIPISSIRLDKYYSSRKVLKDLIGTSVYILPKKNIKRVGMQWNNVLREALGDPIAFMREYYRRNLSETGFSADKNRFGRKLRQRREERREMALQAIALLHNIFITRVAT